ncbi:hypothetical protein Pelo_18514 [Pelomyxa schiedti]|nr:hypothetical protein Pelo_18514 [Pelomyxa schiedti]
MNGPAQNRTEIKRAKISHTNHYTTEPSQFEDDCVHLRDKRPFKGEVEHWNGCGTTHSRTHQSSPSATTAPTTTTTTTAAASGSSSSPNPANNTPTAASSSSSSSSSSSCTTSTASASLGYPSPSAPPRSSSSSSSQRQLSTKTRSSSSSSSSTVTSSTPSVVTKSELKPAVKQPNPPKPKRGKVSGKVEPHKPLVVVGLTPTISIITPGAAVAEGARVAETETNVPNLTSSSSTKSEDPIGTQEILTNNASEHKSGVLSDTTIATSADNSAETRMTSASTGVTTLVGHVTTTKVPSGNFQSVQPHI